MRLNVGELLRLATPPLRKVEYDLSYSLMDKRLRWAPTNSAFP